MAEKVIGPQMGLGFEQVWATLQETGQLLKEVAEAHKETDRKSQETDRRFQETDRLIRELSHRISGMNDNIGFAAETYFQTALSHSMTFGGIHFDDAYPNLKKQHKGKSCEFDLVLVNNEAVAIIEVKHRVHTSLLEEMVEKKRAQFRAFFPEYKDYLLYLGVAGLSLEETVVEEARKYGIGVVRQDGDVVEDYAVPLKAY
ncbi:MAG: hypothetical protein LBG05_02865 [Treponema sp.]|jgi:hypothetical protein|nr:hypothetical protein [Treponema sp.]